MLLTIEQLKPGSYYIPVFKRIEPLTDFNKFVNEYNTDSPFYRYLGSGQFVTEDGEEVDYFYDSELGLNVSVSSTDGFV